MNEIMGQGKLAVLEPVREMVITPMSVLQLAIQQGADVSKLEKLMDMQERWQKGASEKAFIAAMADFKKETIVITRDRENTQYSKPGKPAMYTSIGNLVGTVTPFLSKHGLSASWQIDQSNGIKVGCVITHALGHSETTWLTVPLDTSGAKNPLQQIKSSMTYARTVTLEMACGLASVEGNLDDDGNSSGKSADKGMDQEEFDRLCGLIEAAGSVESLSQMYLAACKDAKEKNDQPAINKFAELKNKRYRELVPKGAK